MYLFISFLLIFSSLAYGSEMPRTDYEFVAASATAQKLGPVGGAGDIIERLIIVPETTGAGTVSIRDGASNAPAYKTDVFVTGTLADLSPIVVNLGARSVSADWNVTTGANVHVIAVGRFK